MKENPADRWGDKNLDEIKKHKFFEGFNWDDVQNIKNETIKDYVKQKFFGHSYPKIYTYFIYKRFAICEKPMNIIK